MGGPGGDTNRVARIEAWLLGGREDFKLALAEIKKHSLPAVRKKLEKKYREVIQPGDWDGLFNEAFYELGKMCQGGRFAARGDIDGLIYQLTRWRVIDRLRRMPKTRIDRDVKLDDVPGPDFARGTDFEILDAIESYVAHLPESKQIVLITAVRIFILKGAEKFSQLPIDQLVREVNKSVDPKMTQGEVVRTLNQEWAQLRAFFGREGF